ncbi:unnamed protein product [Phytophthora fragariaefolia]|uniref:Unnamed protein product n=1 Tax=Phytophthora fragariaefolia TaxID=1490495 RepID=A0A9W6WRQ9_9STRA|nr:unnamed protein product [Phytophthora fragariaefolia]
MGPSSLRFIRGSIASTMSEADSVVVLDGSKNDERRAAHDTDARLDSYESDESPESFETQLSLGSCDSEQDGDVNDCSNRVTVGVPSSSFTSTGDAAPIPDERSTADSVAMLQSMHSDVCISEQRSAQFYIV